MSTSETWIIGKCNQRRIRVKQWQAGFSIKCSLGKKTIVGRPNDPEFLKFDLDTFCDNCEKKEKQANESEKKI